MPLGTFLPLGYCKVSVQICLSYVSLDLLSGHLRWKWTWVWSQQHYMFLPHGHTVVGKYETRSKICHFSIVTMLKRIQPLQRLEATITSSPVTNGDNLMWPFWRGQAAWRLSPPPYHWPWKEKKLRVHGSTPILSFMSLTWAEHKSIFWKKSDQGLTWSLKLLFASPSLSPWLSSESWKRFS